MNQPLFESANQYSRRRWLQTTSAALAASTAGAAATVAQAGEPAGTNAVVNGRINQSVCAWCFGRLGLERLAQEAAAMGLKSVELVEPKDWPTLKKHGLICAMTPSHGLTVGFNDAKNHGPCIEAVRRAIDATSHAKFPNVICFPGNRRGISDDVGLENCVKGLKQIVGYAEEKHVTLCMEVLNSRHDHPDYQCDRVEWGVEVCKRVGSPRMKLLFDIYHVQIMQGDVIARIREFHEFIAHYHTAGVPGRHELDDSQELHYPAIMRAIVASGFQGYVGQEFIPTRDPLATLREAVKLCDV